MKHFTRISSFLLLLLSLSCAREVAQPEVPESIPYGAPVTMNIGFGIPNMYDVEIGTKAEATRADEARVHDLYVMLFDDDNDGEKFYGRYFTYEHLNGSLEVLDGNSNEGWYVENSDNSRGVVKIATESRPNCTLVVLANVSNTITTLTTPTLAEGLDAIDCLAGIDDLSELHNVRVKLEQQVVNRADLFLMMGHAEEINTGDLSWGSFDTSVPPVPTYNKTAQDKYQLELKTLDAKVKFCIKYNETNIDRERSTPRNWWVYNVPSECFLFSSSGNPVGIDFFNAEEAYFEGETEINGDIYQVFSFYMLENLQEPKSSIENLANPDYYLREKEDDASLERANFTYAPEKGTYVKFDIMLALKTPAIQEILGSLEVNHALTSEAMYTIHMGDFTNSDSSVQGHNYDDYNVLRAHSYTYYITIHNSKKIYVEVMGEKTGDTHGTPSEDEPGQEGSLLMSTDEIVNCDAHYEYHCLTFRYTPQLEGKKVSWYVKTPFEPGHGAQWNEAQQDWDFDDDCKDYLWVKFGLNALSGGTYSQNRKPYPGNTHIPSWKPSPSSPLIPNQLMDIHQLFSYILYQTKLRNTWVNGGSLGDDPSDFLYDNDLGEYVIRVTAFVDEFYYDKDPRLDPATAEVDPDLWRVFVNAQPRELHILSDAHYSADDQSDVITSSHSIIQQSIQTFYNIYSPDLTSLWGTEHVDEMEYRIRHKKDGDQTPWPWWEESRALPSNDHKPTDQENGRINSAAIWGVLDHPEWTEGTAPKWNSSEGGFLDYSVDNNTPELSSGEGGGTNYQYLAYSCLTRNRDNNGNGVIDPEEVRWYTAAVNQLVGMWVGNESLTPSARIYQPENKSSRSSDGTEWRAWVVSSTAPSIEDPRTIRAEEGATKSDYSAYNWMLSPQTVFDKAKRHKVSSVRCVRNIGTYSEGGTTEDISGAPFDYMVDQYYESPAGFDGNNKVLKNADNTYTLKFSRLNPKSLREYTSEDLPFHSEYSMHNCVYLELNMQDPANYEYADGASTFPKETQEVINNNITSTGHNSYCPAGYRLPNMTEMLLMVALQPSSYWTSNCEYPTRTYYSRGKIVGSEKWTPGEHQKIGWGYTQSSDRFHMIHDNRDITGVRCVRDNNMTGDITGKVSVVNGNKLSLGDDITIKLNFSSMGSAIKYLGLSLVYVNTNGVETSVTIPTSSVTLSGVSIRDEKVEWTLPDELPLLGNMYIRATVRNNAGISRTFETPIKILSPVFASVRLLHCDYDEDLDNPSFPVLVTASSPSDNITSWKLTVKDPEGESRTFNLTPDTRDTKYWNSLFQYTYTMGTLITGSYSFQLEVTTNSGITTRSDFAIMEVLLANEIFNDGTVGVDYNEASDIDQLWPAQKVEGISFYSGDFIEANMDVTRCTYLPVPEASPNKNRSIGRDNLISVGVTDTDHYAGDISVPYVYHIFYPAHDGGKTSGQDWLRPNISTSEGSSNGFNYKTFIGGDGTGFTLQSGSSYKPKITAHQHFRIDKNGSFWNNQWIDLSLFSGEGDPVAAQASFDRILSSSTVFVGSTQGLHHSRARYCFVRAVHNNSSGNAAGGASSFEDDPVNGGNL